MELTGKDKLDAFKKAHPDAESQLDAWEAEARSALWKTPHDLKRRSPKASLVGKGQAIFNLCWNRYRLWVKIAYNTGTVIVKAIGTHQEYEKWPIE